MKHRRLIFFLFSIMVAFPACVNIIDVARRGDLVTMQTLLEKGADVNTKNKSGRTALMAAAEKGHAVIVKMLLNRGAELGAKDIWGNTAVMLAASQNHVEIIKILKNAGVDKKKGKLVRKQDSEYAHTYNARRKETEYTKLTMKQVGKPKQVLTTESASGLTGINRVLMAAIEIGNADKVSALLDKGADVNAKTNNGMTPLMKAAGGGSTEIVKILIMKGAKIDVKDNNGNTALINAVIEGNAASVQTLLNKGADVNIKNYDGMTAIMCVNDNISIVQALLDKGADINMKDKSGMTLLGRANMLGYKETVTLLKKYGATE